MASGDAWFGGGGFERRSVVALERLTALGVALREVCGARMRRQVTRDQRQARVSDVELDHQAALIA